MAHTPSPLHRRRLAPAALIGGAIATAALALSTSGTLAAFTASIQNTLDTTASGTLVMQEQNAGGTVTCLSTDANPAANTINTNAATCATINKYGGSLVLVPGVGTTTTVTIKNVGTVAANSFSLAPGACTQSNNGPVNGSATDFCGKLGVTLNQTVGGTTTLITPANSTATSLAAGGPLALTAPVAPGATVSFAFTVTLSSTAGNTYQGLAASQPLTWQFTS